MVLPELLQTIGLKVPSFNSKFNPPFAIPHSKNNYFTNSHINTNRFFFEFCNKLKSCIYNLNLDI
jgi:hypothetical protein